MKVCPVCWKLGKSTILAFLFSQIITKVDIQLVLIYLIIPKITRQDP